MKYLLFLLLITDLFSAVLKPSYTLLSEEFNASAIDQNIKNDFIIYTFNKNKHKKSFNSAEIIELFHQHNIELENSTKGLVHVKQVSSVDLSEVKNSIKAYYTRYYPQIEISSVEIKSSTFIHSLPVKYKLVFKSNSYRYASSTLQLQASGSKKRYFINYEISAKIRLFKARHNINRGKILTQIDTLYLLEDFKKLKGTPFKFSHKTEVRSKRRLLEGKVLYAKDVELLPAVLKGNRVLVRLINGSVHLEFQARSLQDADIGDEIYVEKQNKKRLRVRVTGKNQVEIE